MNLRGERVVLRPVTAEDVPELSRILRTPEVYARWGDEDADENWPFDSTDENRLVVELNGATVGLIQYGEETDPMYRHASIDVFLDPAVHGRGVGKDAVGTLVRYLTVELGHHRLVIDPAADNAVAIACYSAVGFEPVGIMRKYEKGPEGWHDSLLMDLIVE
ncbi:GNAT family protein [Rhodococcus sp. 14-2483-1-2]|uniref:GNAT family N-acetyltransferase n=1 Tax=Rhodococcus sp. 14-2483-1-2 TaxID=2023147 RepID=UPI000B9C2B44|nr:GNAT family protein [Rhodococcus sp. 14-2483-1-2]OZF34640.1 GNAT family N-acetyltransferase [Rhodococcus sp. 14-2483-1-2]